MIYLPKTVFLIVSHTNTTHVLNMSHCQQHLQKRYRNKNTKICLFIYCSLCQKPFQLYLNVLSHIIKLYKHGQVMMQRVTITSTHYYTRYHMRYCTFSPSLAWLGYNAICYHNFNMLPRALPYIFSKFSMVWGLFAMRGNVYPLQGLVMCSNTFNMTKMEVTEGYANVSYIARWPIHVCRVWKAAM